MNNWITPQWNTDPTHFRGVGFALAVLPGFTIMPLDNAGFNFIAFPANGMPPPNSLVAVALMPVLPMMLVGAEGDYRNLESPEVAARCAQALGMARIGNIAPLRSTSLNGADVQVREFDAQSYMGRSIRMSAMLLRGPLSAMQVIVGVDLLHWTEWAGLALSIVGQIQLDGTAAPTGAPPQVLSIVDPAQPQKVELQVVDGDKGVAPIMSMPTRVGVTQIFHVTVADGGHIDLGTIQGTIVQMGQHNIVGDTPADPAPAPGISKESMANFSGTNNVQGTYVQQGDTNTINLQNGTADSAQLTKLIDLLQQQINEAGLPHATNLTLNEQVLPGLVAAAQQPQPGEGVADGLVKLNQTLSTAETTTTSFKSIAQTAADIARIVGPGLKIAAPFLWSLL